MHASVPCKDSRLISSPQFREDVAVNPNDTEESIWTFLCEAQMVGAEAARQQFLEVRPCVWYQQ